MIARATTKQLRQLHAEARKHGLDHVGLRTLANVDSLTVLTHACADELIRRFKEDRPKRRSKPAPPGTIKFASPQQRQLIAQLLEETGWPESLRAGWLHKYYRIADVTHDAYSRATASHAIGRLKNAVRNCKRLAAAEYTA